MKRTEMQGHENQTIERAVAKFIVGFGSEHIDADAREDLKALIKDQLAIQIGASQLPWSRQVHRFRKPQPGEATVVGETKKAIAADAAYLNATYGHGFEYDDFAGNAHPGCCVVPTAIAVGEELGASFEDVIVAMVAGYETYVRIGYLCSPALLNAGWQSHSVLANFGAAAAAAKLYGLNEDATFHAIAIALSSCGGPTEYASTGGSIKRVHAGMSVRNGIEAADLARAGITGPRRYLIGDRGFYRMFVKNDVDDSNADTFGLNEPLQLRQLKFKPYCCCAATHGYIDALLPVRGRADDIIAIDTRIQTMSDAIVGNRNANIYAPRNIEELQYSLPAQMALSVLGLGNGYKAHRGYLDGKLSLAPDSPAIQLTKKIKLTVSPELDAKYPRTFAAEMTVHFKDGTSVHLFNDKIKGGPANPFTIDEHRVKLDELTEDVIGLETSARIFDMVDSSEPDMPIRELMKPLSW
jgi:2-methylcitrate dehydratase PrpD